MAILETSERLSPQPSGHIHPPPATGVSMRTSPVAIILDGDDRVVMFNEQGADIMRRFSDSAGPVRPGGFLPGVLHETVQKLHRTHSALAEGAVFVGLAIDLFARVCLLSSENGSTYMMLTFERPRSRDSEVLNLGRYGLTPREREVALLLLRGISNCGIASRLHLTENTVQSYVKMIFAKCAVHTRLEFGTKILGLAGQ